jgi:Na+-driven multidrug efflux pump
MTSTHLAFLQAVKRPRYGFFESILRKVLLPAPLMWLFVHEMAYSVDAVWVSVAAANVLMTVVTVVYGQRTLARLPDSDAKSPKPISA